MTRKVRGEKDDEIVTVVLVVLGWCRNKKYIEKTAAGFMCLVCKKVRVSW